MQGPDRKTPIDGVPEAPELASDSAGPAGPGESPRDASDSAAAPPPPPLPSRPAPLPPATVSLSETPSQNDGSRSEAETPQTAAISAEQDRQPSRRHGTVWTRLASRASRLAFLGPLVGMRNASAVRKAIAVTGGVAAIFGAIHLPRIFGLHEPKTQTHVNAALLAGAVSGMGGMVDGGVAFFVDPSPGSVQDGRPSVSDAGEGPTDGALPDGAAAPGPWRMARLAEDPAVRLVDVSLTRRPLAAALAAAKIPGSEGQRVIASLGDVHGVDHFGPKDALTVALDTSTGHVAAYELASSPADVWQGRDEPQADGPPKLLAKKLKLEVQRVRVRKAVVVGTDLHASFVDAGLASIDDLVAMLDDALDGHAEISDVRPGARLRIIATQDQVDGSFVRWVSLEAVEYFPANPTAPSVRVYRFGDDDPGEVLEKIGAAGKHTTDAKRQRGWYDARGRQPLHGGWRTPVPLARITSRFNPHRMHPVLHVVMPHNGVDFAAPVGTPVYATAAGVVTSVGKEGPCGNKVEVSHPGNITSIYCHLSRFAAGLHVGSRVEQRQLIAYVGQTGRVTGPHLHFGIRRAGIMVDPMTLRLDGMRVVPRAHRDDFDRQRGELDLELDGVALPAAVGVPVEPPEPGDTFYEEP